MLKPWPRPPLDGGGRGPKLRFVCPDFRMVAPITCKMKRKCHYDASRQQRIITTLRKKQHCGNMRVDRGINQLQGWRTLAWGAGFCPGGGTASTRTRC